jgi:hypothetical protein
MRVLLLANTDEPGMSGVGDFACLLAEELRLRGIDAILAAVNQSPAKRRHELSELISEIKPDWVSLHFVPYAYAKRGLVDKHTLPWSDLRGRVGTHILFHEIWIGAYQRANWRHRLIGALQQKGIQQMLGAFKPKVVHCTNTLYSSMLEQAGIANRVLPLFGAIPVSSGSDDPYLNLLTRLEPSRGRSEWMVAALFGSLYPSESFFAVVHWLHACSSKHGKKLMVVSLGNAPTAPAVFDAIQCQFSQGSKPYFHVAGKLNATDLSCWIRNADCGLSSTPFNIIDKSSSAVAFVEHGVPVVVMDEGSPVRGIPHLQQDRSPEFWLFGDQRLQASNCLPPRRDPQSRRDRVVKQFIEDLNLE